ncbi:3'(2'),5'-bisphosphate nucleotidase CysQ [Vicingaceae bacterium]|nr:3'(2'),5'-bisphosphate nucleotidase CysQ [Vicingaceae bacterium]
MNREDWLIIIVNSALSAGNEILSIYNSDFTIESKSDNSPLTEADKNAHNVISEALKTTGIPILSEEGNIPDYEIRKNWKQFWIVDPLDGTKEFVSRNGEFTVNIALIESGKPTMGVIYIPVTQEIYFADGEAYKIDKFIEPTTSMIHLLKQSITLPIKQARNEYVVLASRSHLDTETENFINSQKENHKNVSLLNKGSSLKFCVIAEGSADIYPRYSPTMEWDTAAGHAIINASGSEVINLKTRRPLCYNKKNLLNPPFLVKRK